MHLPRSNRDAGLDGMMDDDGRRPAGLVVNLPILGRRRVRLKPIVVFSVFLGVIFYLGRWTSGATSQHKSETPEPATKVPYTPVRRPPRSQATMGIPEKDDERGKVGMFDKHAYHENGLLEVNRKGKHPIFELMKKAEDDWNAKLRRASATLQDAVEEYIGRYGRDPPKGFDKWCVLLTPLIEFAINGCRWEYAQENNVQLPDEYDIINERLKPFWGVRPIDLREIVNDWEDNSDVPVMVFGKVADRPLRIMKNGMPDADKTMFAEGLLERLQLLRDIEDDLPEFRAIISPADTPNLLIDWELREAALEAAAKRKCELTFLFLIMTTF